MQTHLGSAWGEVSWGRPVFASVRPYGERLRGLSAFPGVETLDALLRDRLGELRLRSQVKPRRRRRGGQEPGYEQQVAEGWLPFREDCWHDLFNVLAWAAFPISKRRLTARQGQIRVRAGGGNRNREQDALAMLDEGGVLLLVGPKDAGEAERALLCSDKEAMASLVARQGLAPLVFGHALLEHVQRFRNLDVRGFGVVLVCPESDRGEVSPATADRLLAEWLDARRGCLVPARERTIMLQSLFA